MEIDERRSDQTALGIDLDSPGIGAIDHIGDDSVIDHHVGIGPTVRGEHRAPANHDHEWPPREASTAIRVGTPFLTCSMIRDRGESATASAISTPRFMGPGCMMTASSGSSADRRVSI